MRKFDVDVLVFDLDGTLIDSKKDIANSLNQTFEELGYAPLPMDVISQFVGNGVRPLIRRAVEAAGHADREQDATDLFLKQYWARMLENTKLFDGVAATLELLDGKYKMAVVSNKMEKYTKKIIMELGLSPYFGDLVYGGDSLPVKKPDPAALMEISRRYNAPTSRMLVVGDSSVDIQTGKNAGAYTVGVTYGFRDTQELVATGADTLIDKFDELADILEIADATLR